MKVGILTFHEGLNHGAFLQAYCTVRYIQELGHEPIIINYKNREHWLKEDIRPWLAYRRPVRFIDQLKKMKAFRRDQKKMPLTKYTRDSNEVRKCHFDGLIVGSDVVWNYRIFGFDDVYFGNVGADLRISYAASFGWVDAHEQHPSMLKDGLRRFDYISVRDDNSQQIVAAITGKVPEIVLDPTFLIDCSSLERSTSRVEQLEDYVLVYAYSLLPDQIASIKAYAKLKGLTTVAVGYRQNWCDKVWMCVGPFEWLALYRRATLIVTSTFHGVIFAIKYRKCFVVNMNDKIRSRVSPLLKLTGGEGCVFDEGTIPDVDAIKLNYELLGRHVDDSRKWLNNALCQR